MAEGKVKWFSEKKGYGFIAQDDGDDLFVHMSEWRGPAGALIAGDRVTFEIREAERGPRAVNVRPVGSETAAQQGYRFLNPYNFVRPLPGRRPKDDVLGNAPPPPHDRYIPNLLSGRIVCKVTAVTPLFVSDSHAIDGESGEHRTFRFFEYDGKPALPASSLRGMLRSVFEAATNSCFSVFAGHKRLSYHLPPYEALKLIPAQVIHEKNSWHLDILNGTTPVVVGEKPKGTQYAAWVMQYNPLWRSRTRSRRPRSPYSRRSHVALGRLGHGDECQAVIEEVEHPLRHFRFWNVVDVAPVTAAPLKTRGPHQRRVTGYLCITNQNIENKHDERLFFCDSGTPVRIPLPRELRKRYKQLIEDYQERHAADVEKRRQQRGRDPSVPPPDQPAGNAPAFSRFILNPNAAELRHGDLVYVMLERIGRAGRVKFIVPVSVPRVGYEQTIGDRLDPGQQADLSSLHKCRSYDELCPACRVFGWVYGTGDPDEPMLDRGERAAYAGRVRLSHGTPAEGRVQQHSEPVTLSILSSPKPTTARFYLRPVDGPPRDGLENSDVDYSEEAEQQIRGRKFYRHHGEQTTEETFGSPRGTKSDQNRTVRGVVAPESSFEFELEYENLDRLELGALLWALELDGWHHRLGLAKPLGFGSVTVSVTKMLTLDAIQRYQEFGPGWIDEVDKHGLVKAFQEAMEARYGEAFYELVSIRDLKALLSTSPDLPVHYPRSTPAPQPDGKNFEWFVGNKRKGGPRIVLRLATEDTEGLPLVDKQGDIV